MSEESKSQMCGPGHFGWNELVTSEVSAAQSFYTQLLGWRTEPFGDGMDYTIFKKGEDGVGGLIKAPQPGIPAHWLPYVFVEDVDATAANAARLGGKVCAPPFDVPKVGRMAVLADPQGATFAVLKPNM